MNKWKALVVGATSILVIGIVSLSIAGTGHVSDPSLLATHFRKGPYLIFPGNQSQMKVLWQLDTLATCTLEWGTDTTYATGNTAVSEYGTDHQYSYTITGLNSLTHYFYRVTANDLIRTSSFYTAPDSTATKVKFLAYGDTRTNVATHNTVAGGMLATCDGDSAYQSVVISVGDLVNTGTNEADWTSQFFNYSYPNIQTMLATIPYQSCMGNHEGTGTLFVKYFPYPFVAGRYWSFDYGPAHFAVVDQYTSYGAGSPQLMWLQNDLATSSKPWKFIVLHEPGWSAGGDHPNNTAVQTYIQPLCLQYGVRIVFGGHNHYYSRAVTNGIEHITTGGGGAPLYAPVPTSPNIVATSMSYHFCKIEIDGSILHFRAINTAGAIIDSFSLGPQPGNIAGIVRAPDGISYLPGVSIITQDSSENVVGTSISSPYGGWNLSLPPGTYHEHLSKAGYIDTVIMNIIVTPGVTTNVDISLTAVNGTIEGKTVYWYDHEIPTEGVIVSTYNSSDALVAVDTSGSQGIYSLSLPPGLYHEQFEEIAFQPLIVDSIRVVSDSITNILAPMRIPCACLYSVGDVNGSGTWTGQDVTYSVRFFKGGPPPPYSVECTPGHTWYTSGDVNGSCSFTGQDVTRMVLHFKSGVPGIPCPNCPPPE